MKPARADLFKKHLVDKLHVLADIRSADKWELRSYLPYFPAQDTESHWRSPKLGCPFAFLVALWQQ